jgi:hypothetical protein
VKAIKAKSQPLTITDLQDYVGIDKIVIYYPLDTGWNDGSSPYLKKHRLIQLPNGGSTLIGQGLFPTDIGGGIHLTISNFGQSARVDFNPSRWSDKAGHTLCHTSKIRESIIWAIEQLIQTCRPIWSIDPNTGLTLDSSFWPRDWESRVKFSEVHTTRDLYVPDEAFSVQSLLCISKKQYPKDSTHRYHGNVQTITWGNRRRARMSFYDKTAKHQLEPGWYRFEVQAHSSALKEFGLVHLSDWDDEKPMAILLDKWEQSRFGETFLIGSGMSDLLRKLKQDLAPRKVASIIGNAYLHSKGMDSGMASRHLKVDEKYLNSIGFKYGMDLESIGDKAVYLSIESGRLAYK